MKGKICFITTSMGRLDHLKKSLPILISQPHSSVILVDYSCPDNSKEWAEENYPECEVVKVTGKKYFSLTKARNAAINRIRYLNDDYWLCFVDADTILADNFTLKIQHLLEKDTFITAYNIKNKVKGLGGLLIVSKIDFLSVGGYDEKIEGYGTNASEIRLRLYFNGLRFKILPGNLASHIDHSHSKTFSRYREKNNVSLYKNTKRLLKKIESWERKTGKTVPRELYNRNRISQIETTLPIRSYPHIRLKVFLRKVRIKLILLTFSK